MVRGDAAGSWWLVYACVCMSVRVVRVVVFVGWVWWVFVGVVGLYIHVNQNASYGWICVSVFLAYYLNMVRSGIERMAVQ